MNTQRVDDTIKLPILSDLEQISMTTISNAVAQFYKVPQAELFNRCRKPMYLKRKYMFYLLVKHFNQDKISLSSIGNFCKDEYNLKPYDHTSVMNGLKEGQNWLETEKSYQDEFLDLQFNIEKIYAEENHQEVEFLRRKRDIILDILKCDDTEQLEELIGKL